MKMMMMEPVCFHFYRFVVAKIMELFLMSRKLIIFLSGGDKN